MKKTFCTYLHRRGDTGQVFYVGKGGPQRPATRANRSLHWRRVADKHGVTIEVCAYWTDEDEAFAHEVFLIETFRSLGHPLVNQTLGGEGRSGFVVSMATKALMSTSIKRAWTPEKRQEHSRKAILRREDPEFVARSLLAIRASKLAPTFAANMSRGVAASWARADVRAKKVRRVQCLESGVTYESIQSAADSLQVSRSGISMVCTGVRKTCGGLTFKYMQKPPTKTKNARQTLSATP